MFGTCVHTVAVDIVSDVQSGSKMDEGDHKDTEPGELFVDTGPTVHLLLSLRNAIVAVTGKDNKNLPCYSLSELWDNS